MKRLVLIAAFLLSAFLNLHAQTSDTSWSFHLSGFVNPVFYADSRQVVGGREGMMLFYPKPVALNANGNDNNAMPSLNMMAITTRLGASFSGPDVLGAHMRGYIEGDFTGATDATINMFRLRHAYIDMKWQSGELLMGQYWYPMVIHEIMPETQPLNMGAPFHPYARYNQVRYTQHLGKIELMGTAAFQLDNKSRGENGSSTEYLKNSCIPELNLQLRYVGKRLFAGAAANLLVTHHSLSDSIVTTNQLYRSTSFSLFAKYQFNGWTLKAQSLLSDNLYEGCTLGGYIESEGNYKPFTFTTIWADFGRSKGNWRPGIFLGYAKNNDFGLHLPANSEVYGRGIELEYLYRIQPRIAFHPGNKFSMHAEVEYTFAQYGKQIPEMSSHYYISDPTNAVGNIRFILGAVYAF